MAKDEMLDQIPEGRILSPFAQASKEGVQLKVHGDIINTYAGTYGSDSITGSSNGHNIYLPRGVDTNGVKGGSDTIIGGKGRDTVVLSGNQSDYVSVLPNIGSYPSSASSFWKDSPQMAYGRIAVLKNVKTGDTYTMRDVEEVVFGNGKLSFDVAKTSAEQIDGRFITPADVRELEEAVKSKKVTAISGREILALAEHDATDAQKLSARVQSTPQAMAALEKLPRNTKDFDAFGDKIAHDLMKANPKLADDVKKLPMVQLSFGSPDEIVSKVAAAPVLDLAPKA